MRDGLLLRYRTQSGVDGLAGRRAPVRGVLVLAGLGVRRRRPPRRRHALFDRLCGLVNDVGLLSEEYDPAGRRMVGNFPQAFSHLALVHAAFDLAEAERRRRAR